MSSNKKCKRCRGTGWISVEDPYLGGLVDTRCPECTP